MEGVVRIPRMALRANNQLMFVDADDRIRMDFVDVIRADAEYAYLRDGSLPAQRISLTVIESAINGMKVRTTAGDPGDETDEAQADTKLAEGPGD